MRRDPGSPGLFDGLAHEPRRHSVQPVRVVVVLDGPGRPQAITSSPRVETRGAVKSSVSLHAGLVLSSAPAAGRAINGFEYRDGRGGTSSRPGVVLHGRAPTRLRPAPTC
jgi:hypothetical protein